MKPGLSLFIRFVILIVIMVNYSCQEDKIEGEVMTDPALIENLYAKSLDTVIIDNQNLVLETAIYRNLSPGGPIPDKDSRLMASIWIVNIDSISITESLSVTKLYLINQDQIWISQTEINSDVYCPEFKAYRISKNGPEWKTGIYIDAIITLIDLTNHEEKYLIARNQLLIKVE